MKVCSLFSGIGGIDLGFQQAGFDIVWANEIDKYASDTYECNFGSESLVRGNIKKIDVCNIPEYDILVAGFPCQAFSTAGKQRGFDDDRGDLFFQEKLLAGAIEGLEIVLNETKDLDTISIIGMPLRIDNGIYNLLFMTDVFVINTSDYQS